MLKISEIITYLEHMNLAAVSRDSGIKYGVLWRAAKGKNVAYETVEKLSDYIEKRREVKKK